MKKLEGLKRAVEICKEFAIVKNEAPIIGMQPGRLQVEASFFYELAGRGLIEIINQNPEHDDKKTVHLEGKIVEETDENKKILIVTVDNEDDR